MNKKKKDKNLEEKDIDIQEVKEGSLPPFKGGKGGFEDDISFEEDENSDKNLNKIEKLKKELKSVKEKEQEYLLGWQKERAEFANYKTKESQKHEQKEERMKSNIIEDFMPIIDSFEMAMKNKQAWEKVDENWRIGIEYIFTQLMQVFENYGLSEIAEVNVDFDPFIHEPLETLEVEDKRQDGKVLEIVQKGYKIGDGVLRAAKVKVGGTSN